MSDIEDFKNWLEGLANVSSFFPDHIQLESFVERGGQGVVYRGKVNQEDAAIKIYFPGQVTERIDREVQAMKELECDSIVRWLWSDNIRIREYELSTVATSFVKGTSLATLLQQNKLEYDLLGTIAYDVAAAIGAMWERRTVHRDLKPSNIMITSDKRACVIDLGIARHLDESSLTRMGATWGTWGYLSPEQARTVRRLTCKSDIYSLGVLLIEAFLGRHPSDRDQKELESLNLHLILPSTLENWEHSDLLKRMLHPRPTARPKPSVILTELSHYANDLQRYSE